MVQKLFKVTIILLIEKLYESYFSARKLKEYYKYFEENFPCEVFESCMNEVKAECVQEFLPDQKQNILENDKKARGFEFPHKSVHCSGNFGLPQYPSDTDTLGDLPTAEAAGRGQNIIYY